MKSTERHKLKQNEFARTVSHARDVIESRRRDIAMGLLAAVVLIAAVAGYAWWRQSRNAQANTLLASALAVHAAPVVPVAAPAPGSPVPVPQPGTFQTQQAKLDAALPKFLEAADRYPNTEAGITARYHAAGILALQGKPAEAEQRYQEVIDKAGRRIYGRTARLGLANVQLAQNKFDSAIAIYTDLSRDTSSQIPVDSVLIQLARAYARAGRRDEAVRTFNRVVEEFPQSLYAADARRELAEVKS